MRKMGIAGIGWLVGFFVSIRMFSYMRKGETDHTGFRIFLAFAVSALFGFIIGSLVNSGLQAIFS